MMKTNLDAQGPRLELNRAFRNEIYDMKDRATMDPSIHRILLGDLIASGYLSKAILQSNNFSDCPPNQSDSPEIIDSNEGSKKELHCLNATKLALALAKTCANLEQQIASDTCANIDVASLQLDDFVVNVQFIGNGQNQIDDLFQHLNYNDPIPAKSSRTKLAIWNIIDIHVQQNNRGTNQSLNNSFLHRKLSPMQMLGNHIHAIYSFNKSNHQSVSVLALMDHCAAMPDQVVSDQNHRSKQRMVQGNNISRLFAALLETSNLPVSICRLVTDMMEGKDQQTNDSNPFQSFEEVIQDLEQMLNAPEIFLFNQDNEFYASNIIFGQRCYGRTKELTTLLEISTQLDQSASASSDSESLQAVFISGVAGSGKSHFVKNVANFLESLGWMVLKVKFKRGNEHGSREIVSSLFENLIANLVEMVDDEDEDVVDYHRRAVEAISKELDQTSLSCLAVFIPGIIDLIPDIEIDNSQIDEAGMSPWQLVFSLSKLLGAILSLGRRIMVCLDDLQWCDGTMLELLKEIILFIGEHDKARQNFLFVGMYRSNEIDESPPFSNRLFSALRKSNQVNITEMKLTSLSREDVADMIMSELRLPRRLVSGLADVVQMRASGHAIFVVQLLNSLVRDSTIAYSPRKHRFDWDTNKIINLKTCESVASLIVSNLSSLQPEALQSLRILSCFGIQFPISLFELLSGCECIPNEGIESFIPGLSDRGILEMVGPSIFFSHDLIQQHVYDNIPLEERRRLHEDIGTYISSKIGLDSAIASKSFEAEVEQLHLNSSTPSPPPPPPPYPLVAVATNQINFAGPKAISERSEQIRFAKWNCRAGKDAGDRSNFQAAVNYCKCGIAFLGNDEDGLWCKDDGTRELCRELHMGLAFAFHQIGELTCSLQQANVIIDNVAFEDSLDAQYILIRSLDGLGRYKEGVAAGLALLRLLKLDIPSEPSPSAIISAMDETGKAASSYSFYQITNISHIVDSKTRSAVKCLTAMIISFFRSASPYLPIIACSIINYSLHNGICVETTSAFVAYGYFKIAYGKYEEGCYWGNVVYQILKGASPQTVATLQTDIMCTWYISIYYHPFRELAFRLSKVYEQSMSLGYVEMALNSLRFSLQLSIYAGGEKLSLVSSTLDELFTSMVKHSKEGAKLMMADKILVAGLVGQPIGPFPEFGGAIHDEQSLLFDAQSKGNCLLIEAIHIRRFFHAFWMGDYTKAIKCSRAISKLASSKMPKLTLDIQKFFMGLIAFQLYRDGEGEEYLEEGKKALEKMEILSKCSTANFQNKVLLIEAEYHASIFNMNAARSAYEASVRSARDHGLMHEQGLACELYGKFLSSIIEAGEALGWFKCAHTCYLQWGAVALAEKLWKDRLSPFLGETPEMSK